VNNGSWHERGMRASGESYCACIPPGTDGDIVEYYISAEDIRGFEVYAPVYAEGEPCSYMVSSKVGMAAGDLAALAFFMLLFYGTVWGGFVRMAVYVRKAEEKKKGYTM